MSPFSGWLNSLFRLNDQKKIVLRPGDDTISDGARNVDVVALFEIERAEIGFDGALAAMDENQLVAVRIAVVERHRLGAARDVQRHIVVPEERHRHALRIALVRRRQLVQIEAMRPELAFEANPAGGRVRVVEVRRLAIEAFAAMLFLEGAIGQPDVRLGGGLALF